MRIVEIVNDCVQCGQKTSTFSIDRGNKDTNMAEVTKDAIEQQKKQIIEPAHKGHDYKLKVFING